MAYLILGLVMFFSIHVVPMAPALREWSRALLSVRVYLLVFSLVSALALILIVIGYGQVRWQVRLDPELWAPPIWLRHITMLLMRLARHRDAAYPAVLNALNIEA